MLRLLIHIRNNITKNDRLRSQPYGGWLLTGELVKHRVEPCIKTKNILKNINKKNRLTIGQFSKLR